MRCGASTFDGDPCSIRNCQDFSVALVVSFLRLSEPPTTISAGADALRPVVFGQRWPSEEIRIGA